MEKGILHIKKKPRHILKDGRQIPIKKEVPEIGKEYDKLECQFEGSPAFKIIVNSIEFSADMVKIEAKKEAIKEAIDYQKKYEDMLKRQANSDDSFELIKAQIPADTKKLLLENGDNFALKHFKFARFEKNENDISKSKFQFFKTERGKIIYEVKHNNYGFGKNEKEANDKIEKIADQHKRSAKHLFTEGCLEVEIFKPDWRVVVGLGTDSVYETGITLHHIYGFPYIPASAIKGITRSYIIVEKFESKEEKALLCKEFCDVFGCPSNSFYKASKKGKITFFDAMPLTAPKLKPDIMNVHYPNYYGGNEPPTDTQNPNPILFLTVEDTKFQFMLGWQKEKDDDKKDNKSNKPLLETAFEWLTNALQERGIGAKTAVGYGYMNNKY